MQIPVVTSPNGKGSINERHELAFGSIGRNGSYAANEATKNADVILALGFSFDDRATSAWLDGYTLAIPPSRLIQIDIDPAEIGRNYPAELGILGDAKASLAQLSSHGRIAAERRALSRHRVAGPAASRPRGLARIPGRPRGVRPGAAAPGTADARAVARRCRRTPSSPATSACTTTGSSSCSMHCGRAS